MRYIFVETNKNKFLPTTLLKNTNHFNKENSRHIKNLNFYDVEFNSKNHVLESGDSVLVQNIFGEKNIYNFYLI